jgi:SAM-dependent methyltransferase
MITDIDLETLTDKSSRDPEIVKLYQEHDFLTAYALHTDARVRQDPQLAIGGDWEEYGSLQRDFLIEQGLRPEHRFLDFGCGSGRLARKLVPYLNKGNYVGLDISAGALGYAVYLACLEGWAEKEPKFDMVDGDILRSFDWPPFDFACAFSVFIHLPSEDVTKMMYAIWSRVTLEGNFLFSYVPTDLPDNTRTGLKQFKHPLSFYQSVARGLGYSLTEVPWPGRQRILRMEK